MLQEWFKTKRLIISFEDVQKVISNRNNYIIINTLAPNEQHCLIPNTISYIEEENQINQLMNQYDFYSKTFVVYGKNCSDESVEKKCKQLRQLGFSNVCCYMGGMFEWLCLQDIYGEDEFPTTTKELDILKYRGISAL
jgi:hypothetical protein